MKLAAASALVAAALFTGAAKGDTLEPGQACQEAITAGYYTPDLLGQCLDDYADSLEESATAEP